MANEILVSSVKELTEAYVQAVMRQNDAEMQFWKIELIGRTGALGAAIANSSRTEPSDPGAEQGV